MRLLLEIMQNWDGQFSQTDSDRARVSRGVSP